MELVLFSEEINLRSGKVTAERKRKDCFFFLSEKLNLELILTQTETVYI